MGMGASNVLDRVAASVGELSAVPPVFQTVLDVPNGGVLFALPALLAVGLLHQAKKYFQLPKGSRPGEHLSGAGLHGPGAAQID